MHLPSYIFLSLSNENAELVDTLEYPRDRINKGNSSMKFFFGVQALVCEIRQWFALLGKHGSVVS